MSLTGTFSDTAKETAVGSIVGERRMLQGTFPIPEAFPVSDRALSPQPHQHKHHPCSHPLTLAALPTSTRFEVLSKPVSPLPTRDPRIRTSDPLTANSQAEARTCYRTHQVQELTNRGEDTIAIRCTLLVKQMVHRLASESLWPLDVVVVLVLSNINGASVYQRSVASLQQRLGRVRRQPIFVGVRGPRVDEQLGHHPLAKPVLGKHPHHRPPQYLFFVCVSERRGGGGGYRVWFLQSTKR